jgi:hypothetical protein
MSRREKEKRGKSDHSWIKHGMAKKVVGAQVGAFRYRFPDANMILIDGNAGDGYGVELQQFDLFDGVTNSKPTPHILADLAREYGCTLCLCEAKRKKRELLSEQFPNALIVATHREAAALAISGGHDYVLWLSDPCGYAGHGVEHMRRLTMPMQGKVQRIMRSDFVIIFNELAVNRVVGARDAPEWQPHQKYVPMLQPTWWLQQLPKRYLARTPVIKQSSGFHFRLMVVTDFLTDGVKRLRHVEIIPRQQGGGSGLDLTGRI